MKLKALSLLGFIFLCIPSVYAQIVELDSDYADWYFSIGKNKKQYMAIVPGSNINDMVCNKIIPNPYLDNNIDQLSWIEDSSFTYVTAFDLQVRSEFNYEVIFEGLDTYAEVYLNNQLVLKSNNMFIAYQRPITGLLRDGTNLLKIIFRSAVEIGKQKASRNKIIYPADNEEGEIKISPYLRKAAFQFGWDINPRLVSCGIWRPIKIVSTPKKLPPKLDKEEVKPSVKPFYKLQMEKDENGESFTFFTTDKKPVQTFMYGANYVPYNMYPLPLKNYKRVAHLQKNQGLPNRYQYYDQLFAELKNYGCKMLRIWGGGWYEDDYFYELADSLHIAIWQDFMFANTMYPGDEEWLNTVKEEIKYNIERIGKHPSLVLWSGNNEIEVAWKNWGWQSKYHYSKEDSLKLIGDYNLLFKIIIPDELKKQNCSVAYISSSPISNWGRSEDFKKGDNHYWGIWHGEAPLEDFNSHVPRFASEYGMPSFGSNSIINFYNSNTQKQQNPFLLNKMKSYKGMKLLNRYITDYLDIRQDDSVMSFASRYLQLKALKMAYNAHLYNFPYCGGSLFWQFNESWPGITWAAIDFSGNRKIPPYQSNFALLVQNNSWLNLKVHQITKRMEVSFIEISLKQIDGTIIKQQQIKCNLNELKSGLEINPCLYFDSLSLKKNYLKIEVKNNFEPAASIWDTLIIFGKEKDFELNKPTILMSKMDESHLKIYSNTLVLGLFLESDDPTIEFNQNFINVEGASIKIISFEHEGNDIDLSKLHLNSIYDLENK